ncbi:hypothetical protein [Desulfofundulus thermocisternus]|uniref:hypothetical protein n=1 Tax=Desulfofundulus thermocisternus TaxID=42471 RepID=UPI0004877B73|nr:hypothetical protein [Desulfofundulus thermocisternus]
MSEKDLRRWLVGVLWFLGRVYCRFALAVVYAVAAAALGGIIAALARREAVETAFHLAFWLSWAALCLRGPCPERGERESYLFRFALPWLVGTGLAAWAVVRCVLPYAEKIIKAWGLA